jgi:hypothetical protein
VNYFNVRQPMSGPEKRRSPRQDVRCVGLIYDEHGSVMAQCIMTDVSASGAKLALEEGFNVPDLFVLTLSRNASVRRNCEVVWRRADSIGVCFVSPR